MAGALDRECSLEFIVGQSIYLFADHYIRRAQMSLE